MGLKKGAEFLRGKRIVVTRPEHQAEKIVKELESLGAIPVHLPAIKVVSCGDAEKIKKVTGDFNSFDWVIFTSANGVRQLLEKIEDEGALQKLRTSQLAAVGPATAEVLEKLLRAPDVIPSEFISDEIINALGEVSGKKILIATARQARRALPDALKEKKADVTELVLYDVETNLDSELIKLINKLDAPDFLTFSSGSSVRGFSELMNKAGRDWLHTVPAVCIGPVTAKALEGYGIVPYGVAKVYTVEGIIEILKN